MDIINISGGIPTSAEVQQVTQKEHALGSTHSMDGKVVEDSSYMPMPQEKELIKAIEVANKKFSGENRELEFSIHEKTKQIMIKVIDSDTKSLVKEIPPEKILDMVANMCEAAGLFVDEKR